MPISANPPLTKPCAACLVSRVPVSRLAREITNTVMLMADEGIRHVRLKPLPIYRASPTPPASGDEKLPWRACSCNIRLPPPSPAAPPNQLAAGHTHNVVRT